MNSIDNKLPHWDLSNVYPGLDSPEFENDLIEVISLNASLEEFIAAKKITRASVPSADAEINEICEVITEMINRINSISRLAITLQNYVASFTTTNSYDTVAMRFRSQIQQQIVRINQAETMFSGWIGALGDRIDTIIDCSPTTKAYDFYLNELASKSKYLMSDPEESLANELSLSGLRAWGKLQNTITSQLTIDFETDGKINKLPLAALQNIRRYNPSESVRKRAFESEIKALESVREPISACMNGVKGYFNVVNHRRGWEDALHPSLYDARIDTLTLEAMMEAIKDSFPAFHKYLKSKAERLGKTALPWWDLFAPIGKNNSTFTWQEAQKFIVDNFGTFSGELASFARFAFDRNWIDAEPRDGKRGGAFCIRIPKVEESRVLCNFDGSLDQVSTIAHELGHAYHIECQKGKEYLQYETPMTLAETASIFCELIIQEAAFKAASNPEDELGILDAALIGDTQVIVDISSRFLFEKEVFQRREEAELSADDYCDIITRTQIATYGEGLDKDNLHPYMWAWKPHYYRYDINFYNYPYAFGLLFSIGLYTIYKQRGKEFIPDFLELLSNTGQASPADLAARLGINIRSSEFWEESLRIISERIDRYLGL